MFEHGDRHATAPRQLGMDVVSTMHMALRSRKQKRFSFNLKFEISYFKGDHIFKDRRLAQKGQCFCMALSRSFVVVHAFDLKTPRAELLFGSTVPPSLGGKRERWPVRKIE
jgi:hypothetical protein